MSADAKLAKAYLDQLCNQLDQTGRVFRLGREWWTLLGVPATVALSLGLGGCSDAGEETAIYSAPAPMEICDDGIDNDGDKNVDCDDSSCAQDPGCSGPVYSAPVEVCDDTVDNDGDSMIDCADPDCATNAICQGVEYAAPGEICDDTVDNDGDGQVDCVDTDCAAFPGCAGYRYGAPM